MIKGKSVIFVLALMVFFVFGILKMDISPTVKGVGCRRMRETHTVNVFFDANTLSNSLIAEIEKDFKSDSVKDALNYLNPDKKVWIRGGSYDIGIIDENAARASSGEVKVGDYVITLDPKYYANEKQRNVLLEWMIYDLVVHEKYGLFNRFIDVQKEIEKIKVANQWKAFWLTYFYQRYSHAITLFTMNALGKNERAYVEAQRIIDFVRKEQLPGITKFPENLIANYISNYIGAVMPFDATGLEGHPLAEGLKHAHQKLESDLNATYDKYLPVNSGFLSGAVKAMHMLVAKEIGSGNFVPGPDKVWALLEDIFRKTIRRQ